MAKTFIDNFVEKKFKGYKHQINRVDANLPPQLTAEKKVCVIGSGIAGSAAAVYLADRGFKVTLYEKNNFLGGKIGSWNVSFPDGYNTSIEHGFHAFFRQYYNLRNMLKKIDAYKYLIPIDDYLIKTLKHGDFSFKNIHTTPIKNILSLRKEYIVLKMPY